MVYLSCKFIFKGDKIMKNFLKNQAGAVIVVIILVIVLAAAGARDSIFSC